MGQPAVTPVSAPVAAANDAAFVSATIAPPNLVFRPGATFSNNGPVQQNVFTTGNSSGVDGLVVLQGVLSGTGLNPAIPLPSTVVGLDFSLRANVYALAANLNLGSSCKLVGLPNAGTSPTLQTGGFAVSGLAEIDGATLSVSGATAIAATPATLALRSATVSSSDGNVLFATSATASVSAFDASQIGDGSHSVLSVGATGTLTLNLYGSTSLKASALSIASGGAAVINAYDPAVTIDASFFTLAGVTVNVLWGSLSINIAGGGGTTALSVRNASYNADSTLGNVPFSLPQLSTVPAGWKVRTTLARGAAVAGSTNQLTSQMSVAPFAGDSILDPFTSVVQTTTWTTNDSGAGNVRGTSVEWEAYFPPSATPYWLSH